MSLEKLHKEKMYVLGPLEISPGNFAVGERSYIAIKDKMPYYNDMRQKFYLNGDKEFGDAIGELETRALTAEDALKRMTSAKKSAETKIETLLEEVKKLEKEMSSLKHEIEKFKKNKNNKMLQ